VTELELVPMLMGMELELLLALSLVKQKDRVLAQSLEFQWAELLGKQLDHD
jgi:hypothetical protein